MIRTLSVALALLIAALVVPASHGQTSPDGPGSVAQAVVPGEFLIKFRDGVSAAERQATLRAIGGHPFARIDSLDVEAVRIAPGRNDGTVQAAAGLARAIEQHPLIEYAEPNILFRAADLAAAPNPPIYLPLVISPPPFVPNDPGLSAQYAWATINAFKGWSLNRGSRQIIVAVIDTGVQLDHPDLAGKLVAGYDFFEDDSSPDDENGHGTHVAGIIGAITNNGIGVAGTCPACRIMPIRVLDSRGWGSLLAVAQGIDWASSHGAQIINLSLTGPNSPTSGPTLERAVTNAWNNGATLVCAAGNGSVSYYDYSYPAAYPACIAVTATDSADQRAWFSNYGTWVDLAAPGLGIYSTTTGSDYAYLSGTSMATPYVSGVAGLLAAQGLRNDQIRDRLCDTADPIAGTGTEWHCGRLNLLRAVSGYQ